MYRNILFEEYGKKLSYVGSLEGFRDMHPYAKIVKIFYLENTQEIVEWFDIPGYEKNYMLGTNGQVKCIRNYLKV